MTKQATRAAQTSPAARRSWQRAPSGAATSPATNAIDGDSSTEWSSAGDGGQRHGPFPAGDRLDPRTAAVPFTGRRLRFEVVSSTGGNSGAAEIEAFERD